MKYLSNYVEEAQTALFDRLGVFFAFSNKQFDEAKKEGVKYTQLGAGLICPVGKAKELMDELDKIHAAGMKQDLEENTREGVIRRELENHECYYTGDIESCVDRIKDYGITAEEIQVVFRSERQKQSA